MAQTIDREVLTRLLRESAGVEEGVDLEAEGVLDTPFVEIGYDSLALLQVTGRIRREYGIDLPDDAVSDAETFRSLLEMIQTAPIVAS